MKHILVTTDLSPESAAAFATARSLAAAFNAKLSLLTVVENPPPVSMIPSIDIPLLPEAAIQEDLRKKAAAVLEDLRRTHFESCACECWVHEGLGPIHGEILGFAEKHAADLIVMTTHGRKGLSHMLIGSITEKVVQNSPIPVVAVPVESKRR